MRARGSSRPPKLLRWIAAWLIRGPQAPFILDDLDDLMVRDIERGMTPRRARVRYATNLLASSLSTWRSRQRAPGLPGISLLDFKLGLRMLVRYPGLTVIGGLAMAFSIAIGAAFFEFVFQFVYPTLPLEDGHRIVAIRNWDVAEGRVEARALRDFVTWREELESVEDLGAFRNLERNLIVGEGGGEPARVAEISASAFRLTRAPPLLGRFLLRADEQPGAPPVTVIGYDVWQGRFGGDPAVVGRTVRLGSEPHTIVGVMPEGYRFPFSHSVWVPLRLDVLEYERGGGPSMTRIFGRLAPGSALEEARAELTALGARAAADFPETHRHLRPQVRPYAQWLDLSGGLSVAALSSNLLLVMFMVLVCANVALLMFARAATRESEMLVRNALGASRGRIVTQLFAEALVLGAAAAVVGLAAAGFTLKWGMRSVAGIESEFPFWFRDSLGPTTMLYAVLLTLIGAAVAGVVPALKVTGRGVASRLRQAAVGGPGPGFGGFWTAVIVTQVAVTVAVPVHAFYVMREAVEIRSLQAGFPAQEYLSVRLVMDREITRSGSAEASRAEPPARFRATYEELERRLAAEPGVAAVTFADRLPGMPHPSVRIELDWDGAGAPDSAAVPRAGVSSVAVEYFDVLSATVVTGRGFHAGDPTSEARPVIANESFVNEVLGGRNPIGQRVRVLDGERAGAAGSPDGPAAPWHEIVGVVRGLVTTAEGSPWEGARLYQPVEAGAVQPVHMAVHVRGDPASFAPRLRALATAVDPGLRLHELMPLDDVQNSGLRWLSFLFWITLLVSAIALLLSLAGIYAVTSFTVSRRTREIGIRVALGAEPRWVITAILRRPLAQLGLGIAAGGVLAVLVAFGESAELDGNVLSAHGVALVLLYAVLMMGVCTLACIVPARRALRVEPTEALRADA